MVREVYKSCELNQIVKDANRIYIYGAGKRAKNARICMLYMGIDVYAHIVSKRDNNPYYLWEKKVYLLSEVCFYKKDVVILAVSDEYQLQVIDGLKNHNIDVIIINHSFDLERHSRSEYKTLKRWERYFTPYYESVIHNYKETKNNVTIEEYINDNLRYFSNGLHIGRLVVPLSTKCSLRCKDCSNLMPYFKQQEDLNIGTILSALKTILQYSVDIMRLEFIGGEPFLAKNLKEALEFAVSEEKIRSVEITTNGTVLPDEDIHDLLRDPQIHLYISDYPVISKQEKLKEYLGNIDVPFTMLNREKWIVPGGIEKRNKDIERLRAEYMSCNAGYICKTLYEDKLFSCARSASLYALGKKDIEYLRIDHTFSMDDYIDFVCRDISNACDYCDVAAKEKIYTDAAVQLNSLLV